MVLAAAGERTCRKRFPEPGFASEDVVRSHEETLYVDRFAVAAVERDCLVGRFTRLMAIVGGPWPHRIVDAYAERGAGHCRPAPRKVRRSACDFPRKVEVLAGLI